MAPSKAVVQVLHCDQGMGTLIKIYEDVMGEEQLSNLVLVDLGAEQGAQTFAEVALETVMDALTKMVDEYRTPRIDLLVISHQDFDHWSLLPDLLKRIKKERPNTQLGRLVCGGTSWGDGPKKCVASYEKHFGITAEKWDKTYSDFWTNPPSVLEDVNDVTFHVLTVNAPITRKNKELERNGTSLVVAVQYGNNWAILPGDATSNTLAEINGILEHWDTEWDESPVWPCIVLTAPHHGSLFTIADNFTTAKPKLNIAKQFAVAVDAVSVAASAGYESWFLHPFKTVMKLLAANAGEEWDLHTCVWFDDKNNEWEETDPMTDQVFTTITNFDDPPSREQWEFDLSWSGEAYVRLAAVSGNPGRVREFERIRAIDPERLRRRLWPPDPERVRRPRPEA